MARARKNASKLAEPLEVVSFFLERRSRFKKKKQPLDFRAAGTEIEFIDNIACPDVYLGIGFKNGLRA